MNGKEDEVQSSPQDAKKRKKHAEQQPRECDDLESVLFQIFRNVSLLAAHCKQLGAAVDPEHLESLQLALRPLRAGDGSGYVRFIEHNVFPDTRMAANNHLYSHRTIASRAIEAPKAQNTQTQAPPTRINVFKEGDYVLFHSESKMTKNH